MNAHASDGRSREDGLPRLTFEQWAACLARHFFRPEFDGVPVMFFVDDDAVATLYGGEPEEAVASLVSCLRPRLDPNRPREVFHRIEREANRWKYRGGEEIPPFLPLLAVAVLAASHVRRTREHASHNYYTPFRDLLGVQVEIADLRASSAEALPYLWRCLQWWLDDKHRGASGFSTIVSGHFHYQYATSQTLFSNSDRDKLTQFFRSIRLVPGEVLEESELMTYFQIWANRRDDLSEGALHMLQDHEYSAQLAAMIKAAADRWRGVVREEGNTSAQILLTLEVIPQARLGLVAERSEGLPPALDCRDSVGHAMVLSSSHDGFYDGLPVKISSRLLRDGLRLRADGIQLHLPPRDVHVLEKNRELGMWASVPQLSPGEPAWLLVHESSLDVLSDYLKASARRGWKVVKGAGIAPEGWRFVRDVVVDASDGEVPSQLAGIVPRERNRFSLRGGLPVGRDSATYLTGGEPDLWLPPFADGFDNSQVAIDGRFLELPSEATRVRLADEELREGDHTISLGEIRRSFTTVRSLGQPKPNPSRKLGHELSARDDVLTAKSFGACSLGPAPADGVVRIVGAVVEDPDATLGRYPSRPVILPTAALGRTLLGAHPGEITEVSAPEVPPWMTKVGLNFRVFEFVADFEVVWVVTEWNLEPAFRVRLTRQLGPGPTNPSTSQSKIDAWRAVILNSPEPVGSARELWESYRKLANEEIAREP